MQKQQLNSKGFGLVGVLIVVAALIVAGGAGAYVYHRDHKAKMETDTGSVITDHSSTTSNSTNTGSTNSTQAKLSVSDVSQFLTDFYNQYIAIASGKNTSTTRAQLVQQDGTSNLVAYYTPKTGYSYPADPILCAQAVPNSISVTNVTPDTDSATGTVVESFGSSTAQVSFTVVKQAGALKIDNIACNPALVASPGGP